MTQYKLVPVEPTEEMIKAFNSLPSSWAAVTFAMKYKTMLDAAPPAASEPVAWIGHSGNLAHSKDSFMPSVRHLSKPLYTAPPTALIEAARQALNALFTMVVEGKSNTFEAQNAITALRAALEGSEA